LNHLPTPDDAPLRSTRVLLVEDDDCLYQALRDSLQDAGCEVLGSCERVSFPIATVPASRLDAALLDMDPLGSARASSLAQQLGARNIPIIWITSRYDRNVAPVSQTDEWLRKPFSERELLGSIACALGKKLEIPHSDCGERPLASANE
jgi:DNA-binding response OmpR family regulator